jgi:hypothetical protein
VLETEQRRKETNWKRLGCVQPNNSSGQVHRTVRWCTGQCPVRQAGSRWTRRSRDLTAAYGYNSPDCPVVHRTIRWANGRQRNGRLRNPRATRGPQQRSIGHTKLSGVHRTVSGAPTDPEDQRSDGPEKEGDCAPDSYSDCPVVHQAVKCTTRQKASLAFHVGLQRLLAALGL